MKKKKLQLKELKVKSFITVVNKEEQRTTKGGYVYKATVDIALSEVIGPGGGSWTSEKTRATNSDDVLKTFGGNNNPKS
jgi:hypothetical protein